MVLNQLQNKINEALKAGEADKVSTYRMLLSALKNEQIAKQHELSEEEEMGVIKRQLKQREEAVEAYKNAGRAEQAESEQKEAELLKEFLPEQMDSGAVEVVVDEVISEMGDVKDFGLVMKNVMVKLKGQADGKIISEIVKKKLQG
jgi:uncharacterized protein